MENSITLSISFLNAMVIAHVLKEVNGKISFGLLTQIKSKYNSGLVDTDTVEVTLLMPEFYNIYGILGQKTEHDFNAVNTSLKQEIGQQVMTRIANTADPEIAALQELAQFMQGQSDLIDSTIQIMKQDGINFIFG